MEYAGVVAAVVGVALWCEHLEWHGPISGIRRLLYLKAQHHRAKARMRAQKNFEGLMLRRQQAMINKGWDQITEDPGVQIMRVMDDGRLPLVED